MRTVRIGCGAGFADDRVEPAVELVEGGALNYLVFECLAERTVALAQLERLSDADSGFNEWLVERMEAVLAPCVARGVRVVTNMGAANPLAAARAILDVAHRLGLDGLRVAAVTGDDVLDIVRGSDLPLTGASGTVAGLGEGIVAANAYLGIGPVVEALQTGADVVVCGRVADPSLFLAPMVHEFGWAEDDWEALARGTAAGHLLECAGQVTGGYFADPGVKEVPGLARLGFPFADICADGSFSVSKVPGSGGRVTEATVAEQLLYEVHDPAGYVTPDTVADFSGARITRVDEDRVAVSGISGGPRPDRLKVSVAYRDGFIGEGQISYAGANVEARGRLALDIVRERLRLLGLDGAETRFDLIGVNAVHRGPDGGGSGHRPAPEVRARVAARTATLTDARRVGREVTALWLNGPAGGAGATRSARENIAVASVMLPRRLVRTDVHLLKA
ncbi:acyclic terpene utilization AtuA family protein [Streptomyces sp. NPDC057253]|uniref:acyclic terpene utilization AtuA family protein n=1 Tax=Streptomyces sp. NPDC057253 TaxID=3346069 RepID=UPI00362A1826